MAMHVHKSLKKFEEKKNNYRTYNFRAFLKVMYVSINCRDSANEMHMRDLFLVNNTGKIKKNFTAGRIRKCL